MNPGVEKGYPLDFISPIRHVASELDRAAPAALSVDEMAGTYTHPNPADINRVCEMHGMNEHDAVRFLIGRAVMALNTKSKTQVEENGHGTWKLAVPFSELRYERKSITRTSASVFETAPFDPLVGQGSKERPAFAENIRHSTREDASLDELRESMRMFGWLPHHPAVMDERGVVLVGHRRMKVAEELGIEPQVVKHTYGSGDAADIERFKIATGSNMGAKPFTDTDWKAIARSMRAKDWTITAIAEALAVAQTTVYETVRDVPVQTFGSESSDPPGGKRNQGRRVATPEVVADVMRLHDTGLGAKKIAERPEIPVGKSTVHEIIREEKAKRAAAAATSAPAPPDLESELDSESESVVDEAPVEAEELTVCTCPNCGHSHPA